MHRRAIHLATGLLLGACSSGTSPRPSGSDDGPGGSGSGSGSGSGGSPVFVPGNPTEREAPPGCGNGELTDDEACDDGNRNPGDGCAANCLGVEAGFSCSPPGAPCRPIARCGDGIVATSELCDDGGVADGDGCSSRCKLEIGFKCDGDPSACTPTHCGDGVQEGAEVCDDSNGLPFDGCSASCQAEPDCAAGACSSSCGDGLVLNEDCDDGNNKDGDGCSAACQVEAGFTCTNDTSCQMLNGKCVLRVPVVLRDFDESHPDFAIGCGTLVSGVVQSMLGPDGKPALANGGAACIESASSFAEWYTSGATNSTIPGELVLHENGNGGFVNRYGPNGEPWLGPESFSNIVYGGPGGTGCAQCTSGQCFDPCTPWGAGNAQACCADQIQESFDGNPLFFPIDSAAAALPGTRFRAKVPEQYGYNGWPWEDAVLPTAGTHNFHFTTEVVYWFRYEAATSATLDFTGDDDVWVFINGHLAVDLGGAHVPEQGSVTLGAATGARFGLTDGNVYEIRVFHAERKVEGSSFKLTLDGFQTARSDCTPVCGDGIVALGEECDDGVNDGGYGECDPGCVLGPRCGDNVVQDGEDCDDGNRLDGDSCGSACRNVIIR